MLCKYRVESTEMLTGKHPVNDMECDGFVIIGLERGRDGEWESVSVRAHGVSIADMANAIYSDSEMRKVAELLVKIEKIQRNPLRRMFARLFGGAEHEEA
jgi:hypothetical protein